MKKTFYIISGIILMIVILYVLQSLLMPKYIEDIPEGALVSEYYKEDKNHDLLFIGDCEVYENFSPKVLWEEYGINSYIRGSAQQLIWQSYYLLKEMLKEEKPKVVVYNVLAMKYGVPQKESYNRMTLDGMKWSKEKIDAINASMLPEEKMIEYIFPILRFHSRWSELSKQDFHYLFHKDKVSNNGYLMNADIRAAGKMPKPRPLTKYKFSDNSYAYLDKMVELCRENGAELVLIKAPVLYPYWHKQWDKQIVKYAKEKKLTYINLLEHIEDAGINFNIDTYDKGLHLNVYGAEKLSRYFGKILRDDMGLADRRSEKELSEIWKDKIISYETEKKEREERRVVE
ncbi:MAG: hypothetical protein ACTTHM_09845 [Peptoanaerobacter stomatis]|uniref:hypothetical protein n=1 Tax=Peptoanaerobacter stomatis TaxID=796937 RepID=UPI003F9FAC1E